MFLPSMQVLSMADTHPDFDLLRSSVSNPNEVSLSMEADNAIANHESSPSLSEPANITSILSSTTDDEDKSTEESELSSEEEVSEAGESTSPPLHLTDPMTVGSSRYLPRDIQHFLLNYPDQRDDSNSNSNLKFFRNEIAFRPSGCTIDRFHEIAFQKYKLLERHHGYIQWLFPIREQGLNFHSSPLQPHEAKTIRESPELKTRVLVSFKIMLDFFGMDLDDENPLVITRHADHRVCRQRYMNLMESYHNYLRITRILKSLCELGHQDYVPSFLLFILAEQSQYNNLNTLELSESMDHYWVYCMRERDAQHSVAKAVKWVRDDGQFSMDVYRRMVQRKQDSGKWEFDPEQEGLQRVRRHRGSGAGAYFLRLRNSRRASLFI